LDPLNPKINFILINQSIALRSCSIQNPVLPARWLENPMPEDFPIKVDEEREEVTVAAGVPQRLLLQYLAGYTHWANSDGWTLPAYSWFIDQTIGGAVSTGTHGSSLSWGSLSSQTVSMRLLVANGTIVNITPESHPHLRRAVGVSVGRLGIIIDLTMRIVPQRPVRRTMTVRSSFLEAALNLSYSRKEIKSIYRY
jgi:FAD/FMN-containing dehydrogenase